MSNWWTFRAKKKGGTSCGDTHLVSATGPPQFGCRTLDPYPLLLYSGRPGTVSVNQLGDDGSAILIAWAPTHLFRRGSPPIAASIPYA